MCRPHNGGMTTPNTLSRSCHLVELTSNSAPEWVHLIPSGEFTGRDGRGPYKLDAAAVLEAFNHWGMPISIDYEHQSLNTIENGQPAPAACWITALESRDTGIWGKAEWTERGATYVTTKEYRYISPVFDYTADNTVVRLVGAGLTNMPNLYLTSINRFHQPKGHTMDMNELKNRIVYLLNLPNTSTDDEILAHISRVFAAHTQSEPLIAQMRSSLKLATDAPLTSVAHAVSQTVSATPDLTKFVPMDEYQRVSHQLNTIQQEARTKHAEDLLKQAIEAGKVAPASEAYFRQQALANPDSFATFIATAPVVVQTGAHTTKPPKSDGSGNPLLDVVKAMK